MPPRIYYHPDLDIKLELSKYLSSRNLKAVSSRKQAKKVSLPPTQSHPFTTLTYEGLSLSECKQRCHITTGQKAIFWMKLHHKFIQDSYAEIPMIVCLPEGQNPKGFIKSWIQVPFSIATHEANAISYYRKNHLF